MGKIYDSILGSPLCETCKDTGTITGKLTTSTITIACPSCGGISKKLRDKLAAIISLMGNQCDICKHANICLPEVNKEDVVNCVMFGEKEENSN